MERQELLQYLTHVYNMELAVYEQEGLVARLQRDCLHQKDSYNRSCDKQLSELRVHPIRTPEDVAEEKALNQQIQQLQRRTFPEPVKPEAPDESTGVGGFLIAAGITIVLMIIAVIIILNQPSIAENPAPFIAVFAVLVTICFVPAFLSKKRIESDYQTRMQDYETACSKAVRDSIRNSDEINRLSRKLSDLHDRQEQEAQNALKQLRSQKRLEIAEKKSTYSRRLNEFYSVNISEVQNTCATLKNTLNELYALNIIYPDYRTLPCVATLLGYLQSERCYELTGPGGAYNLYESEMRANMIITKLDNIENKLDTVAHNQRHLIEAVGQTNQRLNKISSQLSTSISFQREIAANTAAIAENTEAIAHNTRAIAAHSAITSACSIAIAQNTEALKYIALVR